MNAKTPTHIVALSQAQLDAIEPYVSLLSNTRTDPLNVYVGIVVGVAIILVLAAFTISIRQRGKHSRGAVQDDGTRGSLRKTCVRTLRFCSVIEFMNPSTVLVSLATVRPRILRSVLARDRILRVHPEISIPRIQEPSSKEKEELRTPLNFLFFGRAPSIPAR